MFLYKNIHDYHYDHLCEAASYSFWFVTACICFFPCFSAVFICFSKAFPKGEHLNLTCSKNLLWWDSNMPSPVRYSYLSIFTDCNADTFAAYLLTSYCSFSGLILSLIVMISFHILSKGLFLKREWLCDVKVASITKKECGFAVPFCKDS